MTFSLGEFTMGRELSGKPKNWIEPLVVGGKKVERVQLKLDAAGYLALQFLCTVSQVGKPMKNKTEWFRDCIVDRARSYGFDPDAAVERALETGEIPDLGSESEEASED